MFGVKNAALLLKYVIVFLPSTTYMFYKLVYRVTLCGVVR
jgi:hypothetical protein